MKKIKLIYNDWYVNGEYKYPITNGLHPVIRDFIKNYDSTQKNQFYSLWNPLRDDLLTDKFHNESGFWFRHSLFYRFFKSRYGSKVFGNIDDISEEYLCLYPIEVELNNLLRLYDRNMAQFNFNDKSYSNLIEDILSNDILKLLNEKKLIICFTNLMDPSLSYGEIWPLVKKLYDLGVSESQILFLFGNVPIDYVERDCSIISCNTSICENTYMAKLIWDTNLNEPESFLKNSKSIIRSKKFMSLNRYISNRFNRINLYYILLKNNLLDQGHFSFLKNEFGSVYENIKECYPEEDDLIKFENQILNSLPISIDTDHMNEKELTQFHGYYNFNKNFYTDSYINIITETLFDNNQSVFFSEKTWKPIIMMQPFIHLGQPGSLSKLKDLGFKTFHPFINESYDNIIDKKMRFRLIAEEIIRLSKMDIKEIHEWYHSIKDVLLHNYQVFLSYENHFPFNSLLTHLNIKED